MPGQGLKVDIELGGESTLTFDEAMSALDAFVDQRVIVSMADKLGNACAGVAGVLKRRLDVDATSETGRMSLLDVGVDGVVILSAAAYVGARWRTDDQGKYLALQNGEMLLTICRCGRRIDEETA
jgi:hypothetical protein